MISKSQSRCCASVSDSRNVALLRLGRPRLARLDLATFRFIQCRDIMFLEVLQ